MTSVAKLIDVEPVTAIGEDVKPSDNGTKGDSVEIKDEEAEDVEFIVEEENDDVMEPSIGLKFGTEEEMYDFIRGYAKKKGFPVKKRTSKKDLDGIVRWITYACTRAGTKVTKTSNVLKPQPSFKNNCKAKFNASLDADDIWQITMVSLEHNHLCSPKKARFFRCHRKISAEVKRRIIVNDKVGIKVGKTYNSLVAEADGHENVPFIEKDCRNCMEEEKRLRLGEGDSLAVQSYFLKMQAQNAGFFFNMDLDDEGRLQNVFWADGRSREAYKEFGEVVTFDTTYLTNKYSMPFAPFVGVNHHGQSILLGCGLLSKENTDTFIWLFRTWLTCMYECAPSGIITDQDRAMQNAIQIVFPNTRHRWCLWHVMKKLPEKFGAHTEYESISFSLKSVVYDSQSPEEFEENWVLMVEKYKLHENDWLSGLYVERSRWVPCFVKTHFWAGMSTTQRSESMNAFFDGFVHSKTTLKQFVEQYDNALSLYFIFGLNIYSFVLF